MTDNDIINAFLTKVTDTAIEKELQNRCKEFHLAFDAQSKELQKIRQDLQEKEMNFLKAKYYLESLYSLVVAAHT